MLAQAVGTAAGTIPPFTSGSGLGLLASMRTLVEETNACAIPGCSIKIDSFLPCMWTAVSRGYVEPECAHFVQDGLLHGFKVGADLAQLATAGHRWFTNYDSATTLGRAGVAKALGKRVLAGKTLDLGPFTDAMADELRATFPSSFIHPMGAVAKPLQPGQTVADWRPTSDHTRTGFNAATNMDFLRHALTAYDDIAWFLQLGHFMRVSDVEDAFPNLPLHPDVWPFFLCRFFELGGSSCGPVPRASVPGLTPGSSAVPGLAPGAHSATGLTPVLHLFAHLCGDFGAAGMPGTFKIFYADVVVGMARAMHVLTLPMPVYVDDNCLIGPCREEVDSEMVGFQQWAGDTCGLKFKESKDRVAATSQLALGFVWDSTTLTRTLEEGKLQSYLALLLEYGEASVLTLLQMQQMGGKLQRIIMTLPPGAACLATSLYELTAGLKLPWQRRRTTRRARRDFKLVHMLLSMNLGRGFYSYANFKYAPPVYTDASKQARYSGGGWVSACGAYDYFKYGSRAARQCIDFLEGDTVVVAVQRLAHKWRGCVVEFFIDNQSFQKSGAKGRSRAHRLNDLLRELFALMLQFGFVITWTWIATDDNVNADHLSRGRLDDFFRTVYESGLWSDETVPNPEPDAGRVRTLPESRGDISRELATTAEPDPPPAPALDPSAPAFVPTRQAPVADDGAATYFERAMALMGEAVPPARGGGVRVRRGGSLLLVLALFGCFCVQGGTSSPVSAQQASVPYVRASIYAGLTSTMRATIDDIMDNRLSSSSWRTVRSGVKIWFEVCGIYGFDRIIEDDDPERGAMLATFVVHMLQKTELVYSTISQYVWGVRTWQQSQGRIDPLMGVVAWSTFMSAIKVLTWVPGEPRRATPHSVIEAILDVVRLDDFFEVQFAFFMLVLYFSFSRTECPCPKTYKGRECYNADEHFNVQDFDISETHPGGPMAMWVRFRKIKQDPRVERPEARGGGDWACLGNVPNSKWSIVLWYTRLMAFHGGRRDPKAPMFLAADRRRPLIYQRALEFFYAMQTCVGVVPGERSGLHGLRVEGYNRTKRGLGVDVAQAHGLWKSDAHKRYERFCMLLISRIPAVIVGVDPGIVALPAPPNEAEERASGPPRARLTRQNIQVRGAASSEVLEGDGAAGDDESESESDESVEVVINRRVAPHVEVVSGGDAPDVGPSAGHYWLQGSSRPGPTPRPLARPRAQSPDSERRRRRDRGASSSSSVASGPAGS